MTLVWEGMLDDIAPWWCHCSGRIAWFEDMLEQKELGEVIKPPPSAASE